MIDESDRVSGLLALAPSAVIRGLHAEQKKALRMRGRFRGVIAPRRSGKSHLLATWLLGGRPGQVSLYAARTLKSAKAILLPVFAELNAAYDLGLSIRATDGEIRESNGHTIRFHGLKDKTAADLLLGQKFRRVACDEAGAFDSELLEYSVTKVLQPTLFDVRGDMIVTGTPGPVPKGYFYDLVGDPLGSKHPGKWPTHAWTLRDNPHLVGDADENIREILDTNGWSEDNPRAQRELFGRWANDAGSLIYRYQGERWATPPKTGKTVLVVDFAGSDKETADDTAFLVGRQEWESRPHVYLLEGIKKHGINLSEIAAMIRQLKTKHGVGKVLVDAGALGAGYEKTLNEVYKLNVEKADKRDKRARIEVGVAALDTKTLHICEDASAIVNEWLALQWDEKRRDHHPSCADDLSDAMSYLLCEFSMNEAPSKVIDTITASERLEKELFAKAIREAQRGGRNRRM